MASHPLVTRFWWALLLADRSLSDDQRRLLRRIDSRISPRDFVAASNAAHYFHVGLSAVRCIEEGLHAAGRSGIQRVLDFPSGYGRVLRFLVRRFSAARFTAGDLDREAVDFCARTFGASALYSQADFREVLVDGEFDLIWCGSLMTHIDREPALDLLRLFRKNVARSGVVILTTAGENIARRLERGTLYDLTKESALRVAADYARTGFAYADYPGESGYGISLMSPDWVREQVASVGNLREVYYGSAAWDNHQDVFAWVKTG